MPSNIVLFDVDAFFVLGAMTLLESFDNIYVATTQNDVINYIKNNEVDVFMMDPSQYMGSLPEGFFSSIRDISEKIKIVFLIESKNKRNFYINRLHPHIVIEKNVSPDLFVKLLKLINAGIYAGKV